MACLRLKGLTLRSGVIQSPLAACTDLAFRLVARRRGLEFAFLEMVSAHALVQRNAKTLEMLKTLPEDRPLGAQLVGCDPGMMGEAASILEEAGFDLVDVNFGCPVPKVTGGGDGAGSAMLRQPGKAERIFKAMSAAVKRVPVTVKMRKGYSDASGAEAVEIAKRAEACGLSAVTVHGRTREQKYTGRADYAAVGRVKAAVGIPVIGNGDVACAADARRLVAESGCDGVMIGRGGLGNPWVYRAVSEGLSDAPALEDRRDALLEHLALELEHESAWHAVVTMRRVACWYTAGVHGGAEFRAGVCRGETGEQLREMISEFFDRAIRRRGLGEPSPAAAAAPRAGYARGTAREENCRAAAPRAGDARGTAREENGGATAPRAGYARGTAREENGGATGPAAA